MRNDSGKIDSGATWWINITNISNDKKKFILLTCEVWNELNMFEIFSEM